MDRHGGQIDMGDPKTHLKNAKNNMGWTDAQDPTTEKMPKNLGWTDAHDRKTHKTHLKNVKKQPGVDGYPRLQSP
jgi:hypothetical protein